MMPSSNHGTAQKCLLPLVAISPGSTSPEAASGVMVTRADIRNSGSTPWTFTLSTIEFPGSSGWYVGSLRVHGGPE